MKRKSEYASLKAHQGAPACTGHQERRPEIDVLLCWENSCWMPWVLETGGVCSSHSPACLLPSSSLSPAIPQIQRSGVGSRGGSVHLLPMCPRVLPQRSQKDDQQDMTRGAGWGKVSPRRAARGGSLSQGPPTMARSHTASWDHGDASSKDQSSDVSS